MLTWGLLIADHYPFIGVITDPCSDNIAIQTGQRQTEVFGSQENNINSDGHLDKSACKLSLLTALSATVDQDFDILCKYNLGVSGDLITVLSWREFLLI